MKRLAGDDLHVKRQLVTGFVLLSSELLLSRKVQLEVLLFKFLRQERQSLLDDYFGDQEIVR